MRYSKSLRLILCICISLVGAYKAHGQVPQGQVLGRVTDATGAIISGANVQLVNELTGIGEKQLSNSSGDFTFIDLNNGIYRLTVEKPGFKTGVYPAIQVQAEFPRRVDVQLQIGSVSERVEVTGAAAKLDTDSAVLGNVLTEREITGLPINGRDFSLLAIVEPEITFAGTQGYAFQAQLNSFVTVGGNSLIATSYSVDGVDNRSNLWAGAAMNPSVDSIQEFQIEKSQAPAEFGRGGSQLMLVSKSGSNAFHGSLWEYNRNAAMNAGNYYTHVKDGIIRNEYGFNLGGPIIKNKLFFDFNWEGHRQSLLFQGQDTVFTDKMRTGDFSELLPNQVITDPTTGLPFPGNIIPPNRIDPLMLDFLNLMPKATAPGIVNNATVSVPTHTENNQYLARVDYKLSNKDSLFVRGTVQPRHGITAPLAAGWINAQEDYLFTNNGVGWTRTWSPHVITETRVAAHREKTAQVSVQPANPPAEEVQGIGPAPIDHYPFAYISDFGGFGQPGNNVTFDSRNYELSQNVSIAHGKNLFKFGFDGQHYHEDTPVQYTHTSWPILEFADGEYTGLGAADFMLGLPIVGVAYTAIPPKIENLGNYAFFGQDDWKVTQNLTVNIGLRYELPTQQSDENDIWGNFDPELNKIVLAGNYIRPNLGPDFEYTGYSSFLTTANMTNLPLHTLTFQDRTDLAPRFGFAWRPFKNNKTVVRGGYGIYYIRPFGQQNSLSFTVPYGGAFEAINTTPTPTLSADNFFAQGPTGALPPPAPYYRDPHIKYGYSQESSFGIQRELPWGMTAEATVQNQHGIHIEDYWNYDQPHIGPGSIESRTPFPDYSSISGIFGQGFNRYDSLVLLVRKSSAHYTYQASYVWAKNIGEDIVDVYNRNQFNGPENYVPRQLKFHFLMDLPVGKGMRWLNQGGVSNAIIGGWTVSAIASPYSSGQPFSVIYGGDTANINVYTVMADRVCSGHVSHPTTQEWFNPACFVAPAAGTVGDSGTGILFGPGSFSADFAVYKNFTLHENIKTQFRTEMFNVFNHPNLSQPNNVQNGFDFGQVTSVSQVPRVIQLALRVTF